ncbi:hypothetical protein ACFXTH_001823 [Malus domestica]
MCKATPPLCCNGNSDHHYLVSINDSKEPKTLTSPLISKTITAQPEQVHKSQFKPHKKSHFSLALKEANSIAAIAFPMILTSLLLYLRSMISMLFLGRLGERFPRLSGRFPRRGLRQHHRLLHSLRPRHGNGTYLRPSFWRQKTHSARPLFAEDDPPPTIYIVTHFSSLAEHEENPPHLRPGRSHRHRSSVVPPLFSP